MKKYEYKNATVYITVPTEKHLQNIRKATERFMQKLLLKGIDICDRNGHGDRGIGKNNNGTKQRARQTTRRNKQTK